MSIARVTVACAAMILVAAARVDGAASASRAPGLVDPARIAANRADAETLATYRGLLDRGRYRRVDSLATGFAARLEARAALDSLTLARCLDIALDARAHSGDPLRPEWIEIARRAVAIKERVAGAEPSDLAVSLNRLGSLLADDFQLEAAMPFYQRALALNRSAFGPDDPEVARVLINIAILERDRGDWRQAKRDFQHAMAIWDSALKAGVPLLGQHVNSVLDHIWNTGEYAGARSLFERGLSIWEKVVGDEFPYVKVLLQQASTQMGGGGDWRGVSGLMEQVLGGMEGFWDPEHPDVALANHGVGVLYLRMGNYRLARRLLEKALAVWSASVGPDHPDAAWSLSVLADLDLELGQPEEARAHAERAVAIRERAFGPGHPLVASALTRLVSAAEDVGDLREARRLADRILTLRRARLAPDHPDVADALLALAALEYNAGDSLEVIRPHLQQALDALERSLGPEELELGAPLRGLSAVAREQGDYPAALAYVRRAQAILERRLGSHPSMTYPYLRELGLTLFLMGDAAGAIAPLTEDLARVEHVEGPHHLDAAMIRDFLGHTYAALGRDSAAFAEAKQAEEIARRNTQLLIQGLPVRLALNSAARRPTGVHLASDLAVRGEPQDSSRVAQAWDLWVRARLLVLDEVAARRRRTSLSGDSAGRRLAGRVTLGVERLASLVVRGAGADSAAAYARAMDAAERELEDAQRALARASASFRDHQRRDSIGFAEIAGALPPGSALVSYARSRRFRRPDGTLKPGELNPGRYLAFVLGAGAGSPVVVPLGGMQSTDSLIARWRSAASGEIEFRHPRTAEAHCRSVGESLRRRVWDPLIPHLKGARRVFVVPDGAFHLVNLAALPDTMGRYLIESGPVFHHLTSERDLVLPSTPPRSDGGLLAMGGVDFNRFPAAGGNAAPLASSGAAGSGAVAASVFRGAAPRCGDFASQTLGPLPATEPEAREVAVLWRHGAPGPGRAGGGSRLTDPSLTLTGAQADESAFKRLAPGRSALHLATHGFFLGEGCAPGGNVPTGESAANPNPIRRIAADNPLLVSGLALAGFNRRRDAPPGGDDGVLTAEEVAALDLSGVEWVVLSACDTGVGTVAKGEGVLGLRRAFQVAGARTIIMSLWKIEDLATRRWMKGLYRARRERGMPTDEAMRAASLEVLRERRSRGESTHPATWGAFIAAGDWR